MKSVVTLSPDSPPLEAVYTTCVEEDEAFTGSQNEIHCVCLDFQK